MRKGLTQDPDTPQCHEPHSIHGMIHLLLALKDQNLKPLLSCICQEEYCYFSNPDE